MLEQKGLGRYDRSIVEGTPQPLHIWIAILIGHATRCGLSVLRFNQGQWRGIAVDIGASAR